MKHLGRASALFAPEMAKRFKPAVSTARDIFSRIFRAFQNMKEFPSLVDWSI